MKEYRHFTLMDRENLSHLSTQGITQEAIAEHLGFTQSAISRELNRNRNKTSGIYDPEMAHIRAMYRKKRGCKIDKNPELKEHICEKLQLGWAPDIISNRLTMENGLSYVSPETIYDWLYQGPQKKLKLYRLLPRHKSQRGPRKSYEPKAHRIPEKVSIHDRPETINSREEFGHWEGDLIIGKRHKSQILTLQERKSRFVVIRKTVSKQAAVVNAKIEEVGKQLKLAGKAPFLSLTLDNGTEMNEFKALEHDLDVEIYFCDPYAPWQKGGIENVNGIIRRTIPKKSDFNDYSDSDINDLMWNINTTPRKCLGYRTPYEVIANKELQLSKLGKTADPNYALAI